MYLRILKAMAMAAIIALVFAACPQVTDDDDDEDGGKKVRLSLSWTAISPLPFQDLNPVPTIIDGVASDGSSAFVVIGSNGANAYASKLTRPLASGTEWSEDSVDLEFSRAASAIGYLRDSYLVTAGNQETSGVYSTNTTDWTRTGLIGFGSKGMVYGGTQRYYVVGGQGGRVAYTGALNAASFTTISNTITGWPASGPAAYINAGAYGLGLYVFGGGSGRLAYTGTLSNTGPAWDPDPETEPESPFGSGFVNVIVFGEADNRFVAVGDDNAGGGIGAYSDDGKAWTKITDFPAGFEDAGMFSLAYGGGTFVAGNDNGDTAVSADGVNWTDGGRPFGIGEGIVEAIAYGNRNFVAVGRTGTGTMGAAFTLVTP
jgi:hypothetical protein